MSLLNYFDPKPKKGKKSSPKASVGSKRKLSDDAEKPKKKRARMSTGGLAPRRTTATTTTTASTSDSDDDDEVGTGAVIPFGNKSSTKSPKSNANNNENSGDNSNSNNSSNNSNNSNTKTKDENDKKDSYVSDDDEEEDFDVESTSNTKTKTKSKSKSKSPSKSKTKAKSKTADDDGDEKELSTDANDTNNDWETIKSKIDISQLTYSQCDELLHPSWKKQLKNEFTKPYYATLRKKLNTEEKSGAEVFPPVSMVFRAFELCPWDNLRVVILGQDPYHDNGQAEGLCFSVPRGIKVPSSLKNMYKEALTDIGMKTPNHGSLVEWGQQGVLLLNTVLTVRAHKANSHAKYGWQDFTDAVIKKISNSHSGVVFILWGKQAQKKKVLIDKSKHRIVESAHPSGLSASRGFYGSKPYSKTNDLLKQLGKKPINWTITPK